MCAHYAVYAHCVRDYTIVLSSCDMSCLSCHVDSDWLSVRACPVNSAWLLNITGCIARSPRPLSLVSEFLSHNDVQTSWSRTINSNTQSHHKTNLPEIIRAWIVAHSGYSTLTRFRVYCWVMWWCDDVARLCDICCALRHLYILSSWWLTNSDMGDSDRGLWQILLAVRGYSSASVMQITINKASKVWDSETTIA